MAGDTPQDASDATPATTAEEDGQKEFVVPERPARPAFASGLPQREELPQPRSVGLMNLALRSSVVVYLLATGLSVGRLDEIRTKLKDTLAKEAEGHSDTVIGRAVVITLAFVVAVGLAMSVVELVAAKAIRKRHLGGRTAMLVLPIVHLPVLVVVSAFRYDEALGLLLTLVQAVLLVVALGAAAAPSTKRWLVARPPLAIRSMLVQQPATDNS